MALNPDSEEEEMELQKAIRYEEGGRRCIFASTAFLEMMVSFSEREMVMTVYKRNRQFFWYILKNILVQNKSSFRTDHRC